MNSYLIKQINTITNYNNMVTLPSFHSLHSLYTNDLTNINSEYSTITFNLYKFHLQLEKSLTYLFDSSCQRNISNSR